MATEHSRLEQLNRRTRRPCGPGEVVQGLLEELALTQTQLAERLSVSRAAINDLLRGKRALSVDMAQRLGRFFGNGPSVWLRMQDTVDLWDALHMDTALYQSIEPLTRPEGQREEMAL